MYTILLVGDSHETGRLMRFLFELEGYRVIATDTYEDILPLLQQTLPDALLMDVHVQGKETIDLVRQMRALGGTLANAVVVMISEMDYRLECLEAGADQFILKPFLPDQVVDKVASLCRRRCAGQDCADERLAVRSSLDT